MEWAYTMAVPWHARKSTAAAPATKRRADLENCMVRILVAQTSERKRCPAAGLIWIKVAESVPEHYFPLVTGSEVIRLTRRARLRE